MLRPGLRLRLIRNVDKTRGFVNSALSTIQRVLSKSVAVVQLFTGRLLLLHPVVDGDETFLPCAYGYATTIRKAQGASLPAVILFFDHRYPPDRGYGYVGASRAQSKQGLYLYGRMRRTDWLPVGGSGDNEQVNRGIESESDSDSESEDRYDAEEDSDSEDNPFEQLAQRYDEGELGSDDDDAFAHLARSDEENEARDDHALTHGSDDDDPFAHLALRYAENEEGDDLALTQGD